MADQEEPRIERRQGELLIRTAQPCRGRARVQTDILNDIEIAEVSRSAGRDPREEVVVKDTRGHNHVIRSCPDVPGAVADCRELRPGMGLVVRKVQIAATYTIPYLPERVRISDVYSPGDEGGDTEKAGPD